VSSKEPGIAVEHLLQVAIGEEKGTSLVLVSGISDNQ